MILPPEPTTKPAGKLQLARTAEGQNTVKAQRKRLAAVMLKENVCVVVPPSDLGNALLTWYGVCKHQLDAATICRHFCAGGNHPVLAHRGDCIFLFDFLITSQLDCTKFVGLPLVPLLGNGIGRLSTPSQVELGSTQVNKLRKMGFSFQKSIVALHQSGVEPLEWLMSGNSKRGLQLSDDWSGAPIFVVPHTRKTSAAMGTDVADRKKHSPSSDLSGEAKTHPPAVTNSILERLLGFDGCGASSLILDASDLSPLAVAQLTATEPAGKTLLSSSNLLLLTPDRVALLLPEVFPAEWSGTYEIKGWILPADQSNATEAGGKKNDSHEANAPSREWIALLWEYMFRNTGFIDTHFVEVAFLPTSQGTLSRFRPHMPVLMSWPANSDGDGGIEGGDAPTAESAESKLNCILSQLGVRTLNLDILPPNPGSVLCPNFVGRPNREGLLRAIDTLRQDCHLEDVRSLFTLRGIVSKQGIILLRSFLQEEGVRTLTRWERQMLCAMPLFYCPGRRDKNANKLKSSALSSPPRATETCLNMFLSLDELRKGSSEAGSVLAPAPVQFLSCVSETYGLDEHTLSVVTPPELIVVSTLSEHVLLESLGGKELHFASFLVKSFLPNLTSKFCCNMVEVEARDRVIMAMINHFAQLSRSCPDLEPVLREVPFVPTFVMGEDVYSSDGDDDKDRAGMKQDAGEEKSRKDERTLLARCCDLYDPDVKAIVPLLSGAFMPGDAILGDPETRSGALIVLRNLGLRSVLSRQTILSLASGIATGDKPSSYVTRADLLLRYVDANSDRLFTIWEGVSIQDRQRRRKRETKNLMSSATRFLSRAFFASDDTEDTTKEDSTREQAEASLLTFQQKLSSIAWVPVLARSPYEDVVRFPWCANAADCLMVPTSTRPLVDMWQCSISFGLVETTVLSDRMRHFMGWSTPVPALVIARQLVHLGSMFADSQSMRPGTFRLALEGKENALSTLPKPSATTRTQELLSMCSARLPELYSLLDKHVQADVGSGGGGTNKSSSTTSVVGELCGVLRNKKWIWAEGIFVEAERLGFKSELLNVDCRPYLISLPDYLKQLSRSFLQALHVFGVRDVFGASDFAQVLRRIKSDQQQGTQDVDSKGELSSMLSTRLLELSIALVQKLSDSNPAVVDNLELFLPDERRVLRPASGLTFNDVPWMPASESLEGGSSFVHPKISNMVAAKLGVRSLRETMIEANIEDMSPSGDIDWNSRPKGDRLGNDVDASSFGQGEPLTRRLRGIIELYPEGTQVLGELLQNADDAGASEFCLMLNKRQYGSKSVLSNGLSKMQGPALYCYNDAVFQPHDFENLARLGQGSKLGKLATTGRFGLGFNSVYHYTSVPSFVSGDHIVFFDPHTRFCPRATTQRPGLKLRFTENARGSKTSVPLIERFSDQFQPYQFFGCDMLSPYPGTLFRLPLRQAGNCEDDEIKSTVCHIETIEALLESFQSVATRSLLFLRNIKRIRIYCVGSSESASEEDDAVDTGDVALQMQTASVPEEPLLLFEAQVTKRDEKLWQKVPLFLGGSAKEQIFAKLRNTSANDLPKATQIVEITSKVIARGNHTRIDEIITATDTYLISQCIGAGAARDVACDPVSAHLKLIPWGGVAAHLSHNISNDSGDSALNREGRAFCFLPLPVQTHLPVHVNAYFELSSNRRELWLGEDMRGEASQRAAWNRLVIQDAIVPAYLNLLIYAKSLVQRNGNTLEQRQTFLQLFPSLSPDRKDSGSSAGSQNSSRVGASNIWSLVVNGFYSHIRDENVLFCESLELTGRWIKPSEALLMDMENRCAEELHQILLRAGLPVVSIASRGVQHSLLKTGCVSGRVSPNEIRKWLRSLQGQMTSSASLLHTLDRKSKLFLLHYCSEDNLLHDLVGVPLLPLANGSFGVFQPPGASPIFLTRCPTEVHVLQGALSNIMVDPTVLSGLSEPKSSDEATVDDATTSRLRRIAFVLRHEKLAKSTQLCDFSPKSMASLLPLIMPEQYRGHLEVMWTGATPSKTWIRHFWSYVLSRPGGNQDMLRILAEHATYPVLPTVQPESSTLMMLQGGMAAICVDASPSTPEKKKKEERSSSRLHLGDRDIDETNYLTLQCLLRIGVRIVDPALVVRPGIAAGKASGAAVTIFRPNAQVLLADFVQEPTPKGVLESIANCCGGIEHLASTIETRFIGVPDEEVRALKRFLFNEPWQRITDIPVLPVSPPSRQQQNRTNQTWDRVGGYHKAIMLRLPIYELFGNRAGGSASGQATLGALLVKIASGEERLRLLPPSDGSILPELLDENFVRSSNGFDSQILRSFGLSCVKKSDFYTKHLFPRLPILYDTMDADDDDTSLARSCDMQMEHLVNDLGGIIFEQRDFADVLRETAFVPNREGILFTPTALYDPSVASLQELLDASCFPHGRLGRPTALVTLRQLGLRNDLPASGVMSSVESICRSAAACDAEAAFSRALTLLKHLQNMLRGFTMANVLEYNPKGSHVNVKEIYDVLIEIKHLPWIPVMTSPLFKEMPWPQSRGSNTLLPALAPPSKTRPLRDAWLASSQVRILDSQIPKDLFASCPVLAHAFGWDAPLEAKTIARQLSQLARTYNRVSAEKKQHGGGVDSATIREPRSAKLMDAKMTSRTTGEDIPVAQAVLAYSCESEDGKKTHSTISSSKFEDDDYARFANPSMPPEHLVRLQTYLPRIYNRLLRALETGNGVLDEDVHNILSQGTPWVWVGGRFVSSKMCAFKCPASSRPHLYEIPSDMITSFGSLFKRMGIRETFATEDFLAALLSLWREAGGVRGKPSESLSKEQIDFAITIVNILAATNAEQQETDGATTASSKNGEPMDATDPEFDSTQVKKIIETRSLVPDENMCLCASSTMVFDDAPWLSSQIQNRRAMHFVHPSISHTTARAVGVRSLRSLLLSNRVGSDYSFPVSLPSLRAALTGYDHAERILSDACVHVADMLRCDRVDFVWDARTHPAESLMHPGLAKMQGPSILLRFPGAHIDFERLHALLAHPSECAASTPPDIRLKVGGGSCFSGPLRFLSLFQVADCLSIVSGDSLFIVDPLNKKTSAGSLADAVNLSISEYNYVRSSLRRRFPDMFAPFLPMDGSDVAASGSVYDGTLVRVPLRTVASKIGNIVLGSNDMKHLLSAVERSAVASLLFGVYIEQVQVSSIGKSAAMTVAALRGHLDEFIAHVNRQATHVSDKTGGDSEAPSKPSELDNREALLYRCYIRDPHASNSATRSAALAETLRAIRREIEENTRWHKGGFARFFSGGRGSTQISRTYSLFIQSVRYKYAFGTAEPLRLNSTVSAVAEEFEDEFDVSLSLATGETRELALSGKFDPLILAGLRSGAGSGMANLDPHFLSPIVGVAAHVGRRTSVTDKFQAPPHTPGRFMCGSAAGALSGLPFHIMGRFEWAIPSDTRSGGFPESQEGGGGLDKLRTDWNKMLFSELFNSLVISMLQRLKQRFEGEGVPLRLYNYWPCVKGFNRRDTAVPPDTESESESNHKMQAGSATAFSLANDPSPVPDTTKSLIPQTEFFQRLSQKELFYSHSALRFVRLQEGFFPSHVKTCTTRVLAFAETVFAMLSIPGAAAADFESADVSVRTLSPGQVRRFLIQSQHKTDMKQRGSRSRTRHLIPRCAAAVAARARDMEIQKGGTNTTSTTKMADDRAGGGESKDGPNLAVSLLAAELLAFLLSDLSLGDANAITTSVGRELGGLRILPLSDGSLAQIPHEQKRFPVDVASVYTFNSRQNGLLPAKTRTHPKLREALRPSLPWIFDDIAAVDRSGTNIASVDEPNTAPPPAPVTPTPGSSSASVLLSQNGDDTLGVDARRQALFHSLGIVPFSAHALAAHMKDVLPATFRNQLIVRWRPGEDLSHPTMQWMRSFWQEVSINDAESVRLFDSWPLIPLKESELLSCSLLECGIMALDGKDDDAALRNRAQLSREESVGLSNEPADEVTL